MDKKAKIALLILGAYILIFWVGFKSGTTYARMQKKIQFERIEVPAAPCFYVVERQDYGNYSRVTFDAVGDSNAIIKMFMNEKLRPLLKSRDIQIYKETGERVY